MAIMVIPGRLQTAIPLLKKELAQLEAGDIRGGMGKVAVAFPDEGAWKRFHEDLNQWPVITCVKVREGEKRVVSIKDGEARLEQDLL